MSNSTQRRQGSPSRADRKEARQKAASSPVAAAPAAPQPQLSARAEAFRARRGAAAVTSSAFVLTRAQEMLYIRADLRRLVIVASGLLVLMLVILVVVER
ncbi:MAG: hypothetical protein QM692_07165 [Thermomicrobiales bacterium]